MALPSESKSHANSRLRLEAWPSWSRRHGECSGTRSGPVSEARVSLTWPPCTLSVQIKGSLRNAKLLYSQPFARNMRSCKRHQLAATPPKLPGPPLTIEPSGGGSRGPLANTVQLAQAKSAPFPPRALPVTRVHLRRIRHILAPGTFSAREHGASIGDLACPTGAMSPPRQPTRQWQPIAAARRPRSQEIPWRGRFRRPGMSLSRSPDIHGKSVTSWVSHRAAPPQRTTLSEGTFDACLQDAEVYTSSTTHPTSAAP